MQKKKTTPPNNQEERLTLDAEEQQLPVVSGEATNATRVLEMAVVTQEAIRQSWLYRTVVYPPVPVKEPVRPSLSRNPVVNTARAVAFVWNKMLYTMSPTGRLQSFTKTAITAIFIIAVVTAVIAAAFIAILYVITLADQAVRESLVVLLNIIGAAAICTAAWNAWKLVQAYTDKQQPIDSHRISKLGTICCSSILIGLLFLLLSDGLKQDDVQQAILTTGCTLLGIACLFAALVIGKSLVLLIVRVVDTLKDYTTIIALLLLFFTCFIAYKAIVVPLMESPWFGHLIQWIR